MLAATILGSSMAFLDGTVVNVALPVLQRELEATAAEVQWVVELYALFLASLLLVGGALGDRLGRRRVFAMGVLLFTAASVGCGLSAGAGPLILARGAQGIGAALLVPGSLALLGSSFEGERRGRAIGTWSGFTAITAALGPLLGGWLVEHATWRWIFLLNVPLAAAVLAILLRRVPESRDATAGVARLDVAGTVLATTGLGALVYGLIESAELGWRHPAVPGSLLGGAAALAAFLVVESRARAPMMPLSLFRSRTFLGANLLTLLLYAALGGAFFFLPFNLIQVQGYSPTSAGASLLPFTLMLFLLSRWAGGLVVRYGGRLPLTVGPAVAAAGLGLLAAPGVGGRYWTTFFPAVVVVGLGMAISIAPLTTVVLGSVEARHAGLASGINNAVSRVAALISIAVMGLALLTTFDRGLERRLAALDVPPGTRRSLSAQRVELAAIDVPPGLSSRTDADVRRAIADSFVAGFRRIMLGAAALALGAALSAAALIRGGRQSPGEPNGATLRGGRPATP